ncbi:hypothetical protein predicted by Glimmer/Critica [Lactiplantibacillus plantarum]|nr:hypothetical protein predicted by Glimmer/Critica [Lactiplantibacillus plantarum]
MKKIQTGTGHYSSIYKRLSFDLSGSKFMNVISHDDY